MPMATHWRVEVKNNAFYCTFLPIPEILVDRRNPRQGISGGRCAFPRGDRYGARTTSTRPRRNEGVDPPDFNNRELLALLSCVGRTRPLGWLSAPEAASSTGSCPVVTLFPTNSSSSAAAPSGAPSSGRSFSTEPPRVVLLENGTEDEKASAGDHRNRPSPCSFAPRLAGSGMGRRYES